MTPMLSQEVDDLPIYSLMVNRSPERADEAPYAFFRVRTAQDVKFLGSAVFDTRRTRPLVTFVVDPRRPQLVDPRAVVSEVYTIADVIVVESTLTTTAIDDQLPAWLRPHVTSVRVYRPGADVSDDRARHPAVALDSRNPMDNTRSVVTMVHRMVDMLAHERRNRAADTTELEQERERHDTTRKALTAAQEKGRTLRASVEKLTAALAETQRDVFADPEIQFQHDLWLTWLRSTEEGDRGQWTLRKWELGTDFLASIDTQQIVDRDRVLRACVDVVSGRHAEIKSRASHRLRRGAAGAPNHERDVDGAAAWSCSINVGPAAARLRWWERKDGIVELSLVTDHDDVRLSE